ncbi:hypothetical protein OS493_019120 [Desmophyllum pertusum]|uniref:Uncharacterized protein n=1 Tax=Desmophyllum pertusum TaxID=174260 RepID=A0A9W9YPK0_9CNID|nr:hypothetical protein OS493_019120 [Desmophyllum pertusum]
MSGTINNIPITNKIARKKEKEVMLLLLLFNFVTVVAPCFLSVLEERERVCRLFYFVISFVDGTGILAERTTSLMPQDMSGVLYNVRNICTELLVILCGRINYQHHQRNMVIYY